jgi:hypothetical protein
MLQKGNRNDNFWLKVVAIVMAKLAGYFITGGHRSNWELMTLTNGALAWLL